MTDHDDINNDPFAPPDMAGSEPRPIEAVVAEMLKLYVPNFTDQNSFDVAVDAWSRQLRAAIITEGESTLQLPEFDPRTQSYRQIAPLSVVEDEKENK